MNDEWVIIQAFIVHHSSFIIKLLLMKKRDVLEYLLGGALLGGGIYFLFYTERGGRLREKLIETAADKIDNWLEELEEQLAEAEAEILAKEN